MRIQTLLVVSLFVSGWTTAFAAAAGPTSRQWTVDGVTRDAIVVAPDTAKTEPTPLVFAFHGHSGHIAGFSRSFAIHQAWPEAIVVYPQGLPTPGRLVDKEGKLSGWQALAGDQGDRDIKFFDAMLESFKHDYKIDPTRIYVTGHSNGGSFTYVLWRHRGEEIAAFAPIATAWPPFLNHPDAKIDLPKVAQRPVFHIAGKNDPLVKFQWQERTVDAVRQINQCAADGHPWENDCTLYDSPVGAPVITLYHSGGHNIPTVAVKLIVKFFQTHASTTQPAK